MNSIPQRVKLFICCIRSQPDYCFWYFMFKRKCKMFSESFGLLWNWLLSGDKEDINNLGLDTSSGSKACLSKGSYAQTSP